MKRGNMFVRRISALIGVSLVAALALTGCVPADSAKFSAFREAGTRGTRICISNDTDMNVRVKWRGYPNARPIAPGYQNCNSGYETSVADVAAILEYEPNLQPGSPLTLYVEGNNKAVAPADARVYFKKNEENWGARNLGYVGDDVSFQEGWLRVTITSLESSDKNIEWEVTLTPPSGADYSSFIDTRTFGSFM